jgi:hypothetical protein
LPAALFSEGIYVGKQRLLTKVQMRDVEDVVRNLEIPFFFDCFAGYRLG